MLDVDQVATLQDYADEIKKVILQDNLKNTPLHFCINSFCNIFF